MTCVSPPCPASALVALRLRPLNPVVTAATCRCHPLERRGAPLILQQVDVHALAQRISTAYSQSEFSSTTDDHARSRRPQHLRLMPRPCTTRCPTPSRAPALDFGRLYAHPALEAHAQRIQCKCARTLLRGWRRRYGWWSKPSLHLPSEKRLWTVWADAIVWDVGKRVSSFVSRASVLSALSLAPLFDWRFIS